MGASASTLPDKLSEEDLKTICCDMYDQRFYNCLKDDEGLVDRDKFSIISSNAKEQEVLLLFLSFCDGLMDAETFVRFCQHCKLFSKRRFNRKLVEHPIESSAKPDPPQALSFPINYVTFRFSALPSIAAIRGSEVSQLITRLSRADFPSSDNDDIKSSKSAANALTNASVESGKDNSSTEQDVVQDVAVLRIQNVQRSRLAKSESARKKELHRLESLPLEEKQSHKGTVMCPPHIEQGVHELFLAFSPSGEMTVQEFVKLCYDSELIPFEAIHVDFTSRDAKFIFQKVIASHFNPAENSYLPGVILGKRITYEVFRSDLLNDIAEKKNMEVFDLLKFMSEQNGVKRRIYHGEGGPTVMSLLDRSIVDKKIAENSELYERHVLE